MNTPPLERIASDAPAGQMVRHIVTDKFLEDMSCPSPLRDRGELTDLEQAQLSMALPDICGELLAWRRAARRPATQTELERAETISTQLFLARNIIRATPDHPDTMIENACQIILTHSHCPLENQCAREVLNSMQVAA